MQRRFRRRMVPARIGRIDFGDLDRTEPISRVFGLDRGLSVDRYYIEQFLARHADDVAGHVLEVGGPEYTMRFGGDRVTQSDVLHVEDGHGASIVGDLATGSGIPVEVFDAIVLTQTLQFVFDVRAAIETLYRALVPGGVLLLTVPGISQLSRYDAERWGEFWRFTSQSLDRLLAERFVDGDVDVSHFGNVKAATAFLYGLTFEDLDRQSLDVVDGEYELLLAARCVRR